MHTVVAQQKKVITGTTSRRCQDHIAKKKGATWKKENNRQKTMGDIDGGLHPAVDGQSLGER